MTALRRPPPHFRRYPAIATTDHGVRVLEPESLNPFNDSDPMIRRTTDWAIPAGAGIP